MDSFAPTPSHCSAPPPFVQIPFAPPPPYCPYSGLIGTKLPKFSIFGDTMNTASRMESTCTPGGPRLAICLVIQGWVCSPSALHMDQRRRIARMSSYFSTLPHFRPHPAVRRDARAADEEWRQPPRRVAGRWEMAALPQFHPFYCPHLHCCGAQTCVLVIARFTPSRHNPHLCRPLGVWR